MLRNVHVVNALCLAVLVVCALSVVAAQHKGRKLQIEIQHQKDRAERMEVEWGQLQLEQGTWAAPSRVEQIASQQLHLQVPTNAQIQFVRAE